MLVGDPPYPGSTAQAVLGKIIAGKPVSAMEERPSVPANVLWVKRWDALDGTPIPGTNNAARRAISHDSQAVAFSTLGGGRSFTSPPTTLGSWRLSERIPTSGWSRACRSPRRRDSSNLPTLATSTFHPTINGS